MKIVDIQPILKKNENGEYTSCSSDMSFDNGFGCGATAIICDIENLEQFDNIEDIFLIAEKFNLAMKDLKKVSVCGTCKYYRPHNSAGDRCEKRKNVFVSSNYAGCSRWVWRYD